MSEFIKFQRECNRSVRERKVENISKTKSSDVNDDDGVMVIKESVPNNINNLISENSEETFNEFSSSSSSSSEEDDEDRDPTFNSTSDLTFKDKFKDIVANSKVQKKLFREIPPENQIKYSEHKDCNDEIFAACVRCLCLLCYQHFQEDGNDICKLHIDKTERTALKRSLEQEEKTPKKSRKRQRREVNWKRNQSKAKRNSGRKYESSKKVKIPDRKMKESCIIKSQSNTNSERDIPTECLFQCYEQITEEERYNIFR